MRQTAVEWLENKFKEELVLINSADGYHIFIRVEKFDELISKAKEMEKQQIFEALKVNEYELLCWGITAEQYYKKTYESKR